MPGLESFVRTAASRSSRARSSADRAAPPNDPDYRIETRLALNRHVVKYPDAQSVTICVCYIPATGALQRHQVLVGHSLVQAPPGGKGKAGKAKST